VKTITYLLQKKPQKRESLITTKMNVSTKVIVDHPLMSMFITTKNQFFIYAGAKNNTVVCCPTTAQKIAPQCFLNPSRLMPIQPQNTKQSLSTIREKAMPSVCRLYQVIENFPHFLVFLRLFRSFYVFIRRYTSFYVVAHN
jgi:hypothetical protein